MGVDSGRASNRKIQGEPVFREITKKGQYTHVLIKIIISQILRSDGIVFTELTEM